MSDDTERSVASAGSVAWRSLGMISDDRLKSLMADVGMPNSRSLKDALIQCDKEARLDAASRLSLTDAEREGVEAMAHWCDVDSGYCREADDQKAADHYAARAANLRGLLERLG